MWHAVVMDGVCYANDAHTHHALIMMDEASHTSVVSPMLWASQRDGAGSH